MSQSEASPDVTPSSQLVHPKVRFDYLDGLRGFAALYVVIFHIYLDVSKQLPDAGVPQALTNTIQALLSQGHSSVAVFIVLSGYCLMLPVARTLNSQLRGGVLSYFKRRAQRILPPYYAALVLSVFLNMLIPLDLVSSMGRHWSLGQPALTQSAIFSHFLLIHNFTNDWAFKINPPLWSVALEWQIYFLFPFLLLPVLRRFGLVATLAVSCIASVMLSFLIPNSYFIILFTLGMAGAVIEFHKQSSFKFYRNKTFWNSLTILFGIIWLTLAKVYGIKHTLDDLLLGIAIICLIISCSRLVVEGKSSRILRFFESRWALVLGAFSYSLYLTHAMVLAVVELCLSGISMAPLVKLFVLIAIVLPLSIVFAYLFHLVFEKRFMIHGASTMKKTSE